VECLQSFNQNFTINLFVDKIVQKKIFSLTVVCGKIEKAALA
jgi:hypothetical protein